jgi:hypothetical protein
VRRRLASGVGARTTVVGVDDVARRGFLERKTSRRLYDVAAWAELRGGWRGRSVLARLRKTARQRQSVDVGMDMGGAVVASRLLAAERTREGEGDREGIGGWLVAAGLLVAEQSMDGLGSAATTATATSTATAREG